MHSLQDVMEEDGMGLAGVRTPKKNDVGFFHFAVRAGAPARSENRRQTGDAWGVSSPVATIDVVAPDDGPDELLRDVIQFIGSFGTTEHAEGARAVAFHLAAEACRGSVQGFLPTGRSVFTVFIN
jgi:hypothetical protein